VKALIFFGGSRAFVTFFKKIVFHSPKEKNYGLFVMPQIKKKKLFNDRGWINQSQ
jgi:hypothetical protein